MINKTFFFLFRFCKMKFKFLGQQGSSQIRFTGLYLVLKKYYIKVIKKTLLKL